MSSSTSSRSTLTMVPSTMSPSLKYLMVLSTAARKASSVPTSLIATCLGEAPAGTAVVSVDIRWVAPVPIGGSWPAIFMLHGGVSPLRKVGNDANNARHAPPVPRLPDCRQRKPTARAVSYAVTRSSGKPVPGRSNVTAQPSADDDRPEFSVGGQGFSAHG